MSYHGIAGDNTQGGRRGHPMHQAYLATQVAPHHEAHTLAHAHQGISHPDIALGPMMNQFSSLSLPSGNMPQGAGTMPNLGADHPYMSGNNTAVLYTYGINPAHMVSGHENAYAPAVPFSYLPPGNFPPAAYHYGLLPYTPARTPREVPGLEVTRRGSHSTTATESTPATPFFGNVSERMSRTRVAALDRSAYTSPSPRQAGCSTMVGPVAPKTLPVADPELDNVLMQNPAIPRAVPAVFTPQEHVKTLEQCLENRIAGNKNVYIRGLHPTTDDELLLRYASRFGEVEQSKAIIDTSTGACKGFGFAKFKDVRDSEKCICGFYRLGYEVGFARESFNARLKAEGDESSTNLYISNLPKSFNEHQLLTIFHPFVIISSKILRDSMGNSRGVGFARFESRDVCEEIIKHFHNKAVGEEAQLMQIRYADTPAQKELKRVTAERRQYRTNEYNIGAYGTSAVGMNPTIYSQPMWNRRPGPTSHVSPLFRNLGSDNHHEEPSPGMAKVQQKDTSNASSDEASGDEGVSIAESPVVVNGSSQSSPIIKKETP